MRNKELYRRILGIRTPWEVSEIELDLKAGEVKVYVEPRPGVKQRCPQCGLSCPGYDRCRRQWRHLDTCQLKTLPGGKSAVTDVAVHDTNHFEDLLDETNTSGEVSADKGYGDGAREARLTDGG